MKLILSLILGLCLYPLATVVAAQTIAQPGSINGDISAFRGDQNTLVNAIQAIEQSTGGKVLDIRFSNAKGVPAYHAVVLKAAQIHFFQLAELSKNVIELDATSTPVWMLNWRGKADIHYAKAAKISLSNAIMTAQQSHNGSPAAAAGLARSVGNADSEVQAYTVLLDDRGHVRSVSVDMSTGEVIADPSALSY
jgi:uncharacterized membrane protein YkoI